MKFFNRKITIITFLGVILITVFVYLAIFGRALHQPENHIGILLALPKAIFSTEAVCVDDRTYLAKNRDGFIRAMARQGFVYSDQMGAGYFFTKGNTNYLSTSRMYSSYFIIFTYPVSAN